MAESRENSPPLFIPESWPAMFDQVFSFSISQLIQSVFDQVFVVFTFTIAMKTILRRALKILGLVQLLRQSCPHCLWSFKLSKKALRCKKILNRIMLMTNNWRNRKIIRINTQASTVSRPATNEHWASRPPASLFTDTPIEQFQVRASFYLSHCS